MEIYVSTDIETDGPIPGDYSMLSLGSAAYTPDKELVATFYENLELLPGAKQNPSTMDWWKAQPEAWAAARKNPKPPHLVMGAYSKWLRNLPGKPVFVGYPAGFDFTFVYWYLIHFTGDSPFGFSALDIKSYTMALLGTDFKDTVKKVMDQDWFDLIPHTHIALDDAIGQGALFCNILKSRSRYIQTNEEQPQ